MSKRLNYGSSWPTYVQEKEDTPPIYTTGCLYSWKEWFELKKEAKLIKDRQEFDDALNSFKAKLKF
tara:strand:+ start:460 stop:657 length:198 start_codon:yes stop_codon:yes gene_type:complete